ncbi:GtrA family protein [Paenibacillus alvei]|uniref:GtrA family protein n=1 Tax=Paenibacillus alvei TaxID=44250 RepID=UPI00038683CF|nr:membrane protein [Paenibacillus alvei A6-6i-x]
MIEQIREKNNIILQFLKYGVIGIVGTILQSGTLILLVEFFKWEPIISTIIGFIFSLTFSYFANVRWTFPSTCNQIQVFIKYFVVSILGLLLNITVMYLIVYIFELWYLIGQMIVIILVPVFNFTLNKLWAFK